MTAAPACLKERAREPTSLDVIDDVDWASEGPLHHLFDMTAPVLPFFVVRVPL